MTDDVDKLPPSDIKRLKRRTRAVWLFILLALLVIAIWLGSISYIRHGFLGTHPRVDRLETLAKIGEAMTITNVLFSGLGFLALIVTDGPMGEYAKQVDESPRSLLDSCRNKMLRQAELWRVLGRRLTERLQRAKWIEPVHVNGRILYAEREIHLALKRVQREGYLLSSRVRNGSLSVRPKV